MPPNDLGGMKPRCWRAPFSAVLVASRAAVLGLGVAACTGAIGDGGAERNAGGSGPGVSPGAGSGSSAPTEPTTRTPDAMLAPCNSRSGRAVGGSPLRRLSADEYDNTVRDLLGDATRPGRMLPQEPVAYGFRNNADAATVNEDLVDRYRALAEQVAARAASMAAALADCDAAGPGEQACAQRFIVRFGRRAWRRPLDDSETATLLAVYKTGRQGGIFTTGIELVLQAALQSAPFLYRIELGLPAPAGDRLTRLSPWETASRLSYLLWGSMPDDELAAAADADQLNTPAQIQAQARRMIAVAATKSQVTGFFTQWLSLDDIEHAEKDKKAFPAYTTAVPGLFKQETASFLDHVLWPAGGRGGGAWQTILTAPYTFADPALAKYYGLPAPATNSFERVSLDGAGRRGLLTQGAFLAAQAKANQTSPVLRGKYVRERLLCQTLPPPPPDVEAKAPEPDAQLTTRQRYAAHAEQPVCAACHKLMDPIGLGFENFDAAAGWRTSENGRPIDASGDIAQSDVAGPYSGAVELATRLGDSEQVRQCLGLNWFRFSFGRLEAESDACTLANIAGQLGADGSTEDLLLAVVASDAFMYRTVGGGQ